MNNLNNKINPFVEFPLQENEQVKLMYSIPGVVDITENRYYITSFGRVFSLHPKRNNGELKELKQSITKDGYNETHVSYYGKDKTYKTSRLVLFYFDHVPDKPWFYEANHKDYVRDNNHIDNLEWLSHNENIKYSDCNKNKITDDQLKDIYIRIHINKEPAEEVAKYYGRHKNVIVCAANGTGRYREAIERLGLPVNTKLPISDKDIIDIYNACLNGIDDKILAKKYNLHPMTILRIRTKKDRFGEIVKDLPDIPLHSNAKFTPEQAMEIHNEAINSELTNAELCKKYNISSLTLRDIKFCKNNYSYLLEMDANIPDKFSNKHNPSKDNLFASRFTEAEALEIYKKIKSGITMTEIARENNCDYDTVKRIKDCDSSYKYLKEKYGLEPIRLGNENRETREFGSNPVRLSELEALGIYMAIMSGQNGLTISKKIGCSYDTIKKIRRCEKPYNYISDKYGFPPLK